MRTIIVTVSLMLVVAPAAFSQETQTAPAMQMESPAQTSGDFQSAMRLYRQKRYADAIAAFEQINQADPNNAAAFYFAGYAHYVMGHHQEAVSSFEKAFQANPNFDPRPYFHRGA